MKVAGRGDVPPFYVMEVMKAAADRQRATGDVIHLEVGQPSTSAPEAVLAAAQRALVGDRLGYTDAFGVPQLRERISCFYQEQYGVAVDPDRVIVTIGASAGCILALLGAFDAGDRVGVTEPGYPAYRNMLHALGLEPVPLRVGPDTRYVPTPEMIEAALPIDGFLIASPANPTGTALETEEMRRLTSICETNGIRLLSDEIYHGITYGADAPTALRTSESAIVVQSFSKYFSMTGWRLGWLVVPDELRTPVERLAQNLFISPPTLAQLAAIAAFDSREELDRNVARYARSREVVLSGLNAVGLTRYAPPDGAFYVYVDVSDLTDNSQDLCGRWLDDIGIAITPGLDFDPAGGHRFVRISYSEATEDIAVAMDRLSGWMRDRAV